MGELRQILKNFKKNVSRLIQVSIINLKGEVLMNTYVTPKECIKRYCTWIHGISERKVIGRMDEDDCISKVRGLLRGKILMGCDLQGDIKALNPRTTKNCYAY